MSIETNKYQEELEDLNYTKTIRKSIVGSLMKDNKVPEDTETVKVLLTTLTDLDKAAISKMKIKSDDEGNKNNNSSASLIANILSKIEPARIIAQNTDINRLPPSLSNDIPRPTILPGELDIGISNTNYETFSSEHFRQETN